MEFIYYAILNLLNALSSWPQGPYDKSILENSSVGLHFDQAANGDAWLIGEVLVFIFLFCTGQIEPKLIRACLSVLEVIA